ncbi:hypothetical protein EVAR_17658_1 [Eumeta japonica]|uniref:Uncharacterized protein n=1 Tax=Eumeta variegata TaxID=151549 RepID=A0A4C1URN1_EUMVA|nr:hypothetical protein EVAR_17658_1 [Eumeta japonica]
MPTGAYDTSRSRHPDSTKYSTVPSRRPIQQLRDEIPRLTEINSPYSTLGNGTLPSSRPSLARFAVYRCYVAARAPMKQWQRLSYAIALARPSCAPAREAPVRMSVVVASGGRPRRRLTGSD